jgi:gliding motility-associated-like protein
MLIFKRLFSLLFLAVLFYSKTLAFTEATITCIKVQSNGNVVVSFKESIDKTLGLFKYKLYASNVPIPNKGTGTYIGFKLAFPSPSNLSFTDITNNGNNSEVYYRIDAVNSDSSVVIASECIASIHLKLSGTSKITSSWNAPSSTIFNITSSGFKYQISRIVNGAETDTFGVKPSQFDDFTPACQPVTYIVRLKTIYGCSFESNIPGTISVVASPDRLFIDSVSFDDNNNLIITWPNKKTTDIIVENYLDLFDASNTATTNLLSQTPSIPNTFFVNNNILPSPETMKLTFCIYNKNTCGLFGPSTSAPEIRFSPIFLDTIKDPCKNSYNIKIHGGSELERGVVYYKVFLKTNSDEIKAIDSIPAIPGKNNIYNYELDSLKEGSSYKLFVRAYNLYGNASATSMRYSFKPVFANTTEPNSFHLKSISTNSNDLQNVAKFIYKGNRIFKKFELVRVDCNDENRDGEIVVGAVGFGLTSGALDEYLIKDVSAKIFTKSYCYYVRAINNCDLVGGKTEVHKNVLLDIREGKDVMHQQLTWNNYEGFSKGVEKYKVYRIVDFKPSLSYHKIVTPAANGKLNVYEDDISSLTKNDGRILYYIQSIEAAGNSFGSDSAISNIDTANSTPDFFIPSAFSPNGTLENQVFKPSRFFIGFEDYKFEIYNRFGQIVWSTDDVNRGWDGKEAQSDVYVYKIYYTDAEGRKRNRYGDFLLIK